VAALLYLCTALVCLALARRVEKVSLPAAAALMLLPLVFTGPALLTSRIYAPIDLAYSAEPLASLAQHAGVTHIANATASDVYTQFVPWNAALRWAAAHHEWPLWNPFEMCGGVLAAAAQSAPYHPLTLLGLLLPQPQALTFAAAMLFFIAALSMFLLARELELGEIASLFAAAAWAFSTDLVSFAHTAHGNATAMMPLVLLAARRAARGPGLRSAALLTIVLTLLMLCGHPESMLHAVFLAVVFALYEMWSAAREKAERLAGRESPDSPSNLPASRPFNIPRSIAYALAAGVVTLLLTAFFVLPMFDAIGQTREYLHRTSAEGAGRRTATMVEVAHVLQLQFVPFVEGQSGVEAAEHPLSHGWAGSGYVGALAFPLAVYALWRARRRTTWFFAVVVVFGWLMGAETPGLAGLFLHLPLFSISINARMIAFAALGTSVLAAIGLDEWLRRGDRRELGLLLGFASVVMAVVVAAITPSLLAAGLSQSLIRVGASRELLPLLLAFALTRVLTAPRAIALALLALLLLQRGGEAGGLQPTLDTRAFYPRIAGLDRLLRDDARPYRIVGQSTLLPPDIAAHYELEDVRGYQAMTFARLAATFPLWCKPQPVWSNRVDDLTVPMLSLMNVRYAFATAHTPTPPGWQHRGSFPGYELLENRTVLPRAFIPAFVHEGVKQQDIVAAMAGARDFGAEAWIESGGAAATHPNGHGRIALRRRGSRLRMRIDMDAPGWVVVSEPAWRGWCLLDGDRPLDVRFADSTFVAFHLQPGSHDIRMYYRPASFVTGAAISSVTALALLAAAILLRRRWRYDE
jgi:hypothetical protein